jgi:DNA replication protein DnaC
MDDNNQPALLLASGIQTTVSEPTLSQFQEFLERQKYERERYKREHEVKPVEFSALTAVETNESRLAREERDAERAAIRADRERYERFKELKRSAGDRYRFCTLENFETARPQQGKVIKALYDYLDADFPGSVILYGPVGTGKDHLAFAVCFAAVKSGRTVKWINGQNFFGTVRDAMDTDRSESSIIADLVRPNLLCLSDPLPPVGALTQHQATMLYRLVDARYSKGVPTICTVNVASDTEADERMGAATWDRLCHDAYKIACNWPTYRKPAKQIG